jgi:uncharacterized membrane protein YuzA (DUF378 family)
MNATLQAALFIIGFVGILLLYIYGIARANRRWSGRVPQRTYTNVEAFIIGGIVFGIVGMFQPWTMALYRIGFFALLFSTLAFIVWSHISPATVRRDEQPDEHPYLEGPVSVSGIEVTQLSK